jgi:hypothetical protein
MLPWQLGHFTVLPAAAFGARNDFPQPVHEMGMFSDLFCAVAGEGWADAAFGAPGAALGVATGLLSAGLAAAGLAGVAELAGTSFKALQDGQRAFFPAAVSGTCKVFWQALQVKRIDIERYG